jgi:hypothetical protein
MVASPRRIDFGLHAPQSIETLYAADRQGWLVGETLELRVGQ